MSGRRGLVLLSVSVTAHLALLGVLAAARLGGLPVLVVDLTAEEQRLAEESARAPAARRSTLARVERQAPAAAPRAPVVEPPPAPERPQRTQPERAEAAAPPAAAEAPRAAEPSPATSVVVASQPEAAAGPPATRPSSGAAATSTTRPLATGGSSPEAAMGPRDVPAVALARPGPTRSGPGEYAAYLGEFRRRVQQSLGYPLAARRRGLSGTVELDVTIDRTGRVSDVLVSTSSSHGILDDAAVEAVRRMGPVPFPEHLPPRPIRVKLPLVFELR